MKFRLFRLSWKARGNLICTFNIIFCFFSFQQSLLLCHKGEFHSPSEGESEYSEHSSYTVDLKFSDEKDMRFIKTHSWVFRSKKELLKFGIWKIASNSMFSLDALYRSAMCTFISQQQTIASRNDIPHSSIGNISKFSKV